MQIPVLLRQICSEIQPDLNLPRLNADQVCANRSHHSLTGKSLLKVFFVVRVQWLKDLHKLLALTGVVFAALRTRHRLAHF